ALPGAGHRAILPLRIAGAVFQVAGRGAGEERVGLAAPFLGAGTLALAHGPHVERTVVVPAAVVPPLLPQAPAPAPLRAPGAGVGAAPGPVDLVLQVALPLATQIGVGPATPILAAGRLALAEARRLERVVVASRMVEPVLLGKILGAHRFGGGDGEQ